MLKFIKSGFTILVLGALLSACSQAAHPVCKDESSTTAYAVKWVEELGAAKKAGKFTTAQFIDIQGKSFEKVGLLQASDWSGYCIFLDGVRKDKGF
jgi:hypothetical protein